MEDEKEKLIDKLTSVATSRLKIPIISTYIAVLIIFNWDIIYYIIFQEDSAIDKIEYIKINYHHEYYYRIFECLIIAITILIIFTVLNTILNLSLKWFYKKDKEVREEIDSHEKIKKLTEQLSIALKEITILKDKNINLSSINENLSNNPLSKYNFEKSEIAQKELSNIINSLSQNEYGDKQIYSLQEFISLIKKDPNISLDSLLNIATYKDEMNNVINYLGNKKLLEVVKSKDNDEIRIYFRLNKSFEEILKLK